MEDELLDPSVEVTLVNCDREPIHIPGAIQPHGLLFTTTEPEFCIQQASANVDSFLGRPIDRVLGATVDEVLGTTALDALRAAAARGLGAHRESVAIGPLHSVALGGVSEFELSVHRADGLIVCELEPAVSTDSLGAATVDAGELPSVTQGAEQLFARAATEIRGLTGYDRVMVYRFDPDGHGEVVGEARRADKDPLLGHHYPASDIPRQARALYLRQIIRMIVDVDYEPATIVPADSPVTGAPLDLGLSTLRSVSPIHLQYLRNMGVTATLTISLIRDGELWGMVACHHDSALFVPRRIRRACRFIGELVSAQLDNMEATDFARERDALTVARAEILRRLRSAASLGEGMGDAAESLAEMLDSDGVSIITQNGRITAGYVPKPGAEAEILKEVPARRPLVIDRLSRDMPAVSAFTELSGVLALPLPAAIGSHIVWYRDDWARELKWGGDPNASLRPDLSTMDVKSLSPRRSFETWRQAVVGQSRPWTRAQTEAAIEFVEALAR